MDLKTSQSYVISLDAIDLNYIPTLNKYKGHEATVIWTTKNLSRRDEEYYEFEIMERFENELDENSNSRYTKIPCYICNIEIPKIFFKEHLNSRKHKTLQKIINVSLDRMKKVINSEHVYEVTGLNKSIYFCEPCADVVKTNEKISHESSLNHIRSLEVDKISRIFLDLYTDSQEVGDDMAGVEKSLQSITKNLMTSNGNNFHCEQRTSRETIELSHTNNTSQNNNITMSKEKQVAADVVPTSTKDLNRKVKGPCNKEVMVHRDSRVEVNSFYCAACEINIPNHTYNICSHLTSPLHINEANMLPEEMLVRVHYNIDLTEFPKLGCSLCDRKKLINPRNASCHIFGKTHKIMYNKSLSDNKIIASTGNKYYCDICQVIINPMHELGHCQTAKHINNLNLLTDCQSV